MTSDEENEAAEVEGSGPEEGTPEWADLARQDLHSSDGKRRKTKTERKREAKFKRIGSLGDKPAIEVLETAAQSVGLGLEELVNLVADSGIMAAPPSDEITEVVTLGDLGKHMRSRMGEMPKAKLPEWFKNLSKVQKGATVVELRNDGATTFLLAHSFGVTPEVINGIYNAYADKVGQNTTNMRLTTIVGQMQLAAERAQQGAADKDDWNGYWRVQKELIGLLQTLGVVDKAAHRVEVQHTLGDREKENLDQLAALRLKQMKAKERVKKIEAEVHAAPTEAATTPEAT